MIFGGEPQGRDADDERFGVEQMQLSTTFWQPPIDALRDSDVPVVVGIGTESTGQLCDRSSRALAAALDLQPTMFPGDHIGFAEQPEPFAAALRDVLVHGQDIARPWDTYATNRGGQAWEAASTAASMRAS